MPKFRKKPVVIEARQFTPQSADDIIEWGAKYGVMITPHPIVHDLYTNVARKTTLNIPTLEGDHRADIGDWIIRGVQDEFYPCKPDIFEAIYKSVE